MIELMNQCGVEGYGHYWILTEILASKLEKKTDEEFNETHCKINLHERLVRERLRLSSTKLRRWLDLCSTLNLFRHEYLGNEIKFYVPKLLECLDRDSKRARPVRAKTAPKPRLELDKEKDKELDVEQKGIFVSGDEKNPKDLTPEQRREVIENLKTEFPNVGGLK